MQCEQIELFCNGLVANIIPKAEKIKGKFWDYFEKNTLAAVGKIGD